LLGPLCALGFLAQCNYVHTFYNLLVLPKLMRHFAMQCCAELHHKPKRVVVQL